MGRMGLGSNEAQIGGGGGGGVCSESAPRPAGPFLGLAACARQPFPVRSGNGPKGFDLSSIWVGLSSASIATFSTQLKADTGSTGGGSVQRSGWPQRGRGDARWGWLRRSGARSRALRLAPKWAADWLGSSVCTNSKRLPNTNLLALLCRGQPCPLQQHLGQPRQRESIKQTRVMDPSWPLYSVSIARS